MDIKKGNTDCVYFLASPLTCKKGMECEFRHSEVARLNPRDCYYWLAGNCLNPTCSFRHPPLERPETSSEPATVPQHSSLPATVPQHSSVLVSKVSVPCYFYFNGFCKKGDKCTFMHGPSDVSATLKVPKKTPTVNNINPLETKTSTESIKVQHVIEALSNSVRSNTSKSAVKVQFRPEEVASQPVESEVLEQSSSLLASMPGCEKEPVKSDTPLSAEDNGEQSPSPELKISGEQVREEHIEQEEWWESSPGLDVLVDNESEGYEDDHEYVPVHDGEVSRLHDHMLQREYEDSVGYDPMEYPGAEVMYVSGIHDVYVDLDEEKMFDYACGAAKHLMDRDVDHVPFREREILPRKVEVKGRNGLDLRDELRKRKRLEGYQPYRIPRRYGPTSLEIKGEEHPRLHHMSHHPHHRRLASVVSHRTIGHDSQNDCGISCVDRRSLLSLSETRRSNSRQHENENRRRPHFLPSKVSTRAPIFREMRGRPDATTPGLFTGPKSLAQIKEEKMKPAEAGRGESFGSRRHRVSRTRTSVGDFEGPKPLNEILKEKKRSGSVNDISSTPRSEQNHQCVGDERRNDEVFEKKSIESVIDEDEEDGYEDYYEGDGGFEEKLASIYS